MKQSKHSVCLALGDIRRYCHYKVRVTIFWYDGLARDMLHQNTKDQGEYQMGRVAHISFVRNENIEQLLLLIYLFSRRHEIIYNTSSFLTVLTSLPTLLSTFASSYMRRLDYVHNQQSMYLEHLLDNSGEHYLTALHYSLCTSCDSSSSPSDSSETHEFRISNWRR